MEITDEKRKEIANIGIRVFCYFGSRKVGLYKVLLVQIVGIL